jgi:hypothetical protein
LSSKVISLSTLITISIVLIPFFSKFFFLPLIYLPIYLFLIYLELCRKRDKFLLKKSLLYLIILILFSSLLSFNNIVNITSCFIYTSMWIVNLLLANYIALHDNKNVFYKSCVFGGFILIIFTIILNVIGYDSASYFNSHGVNVNQISFIVFFPIFYLLKKNIFSFLIINLPVLIVLGSRMLMLKSFFIFLSRYLKFRYLITTLLFVIIISILVNPLFFHRIYHIFLSLTNYDFSIIGAYDDERRLSLLFVGLYIIHDLFPFGTGLGLSNYTNFSYNYITLFPSHRVGISHNFYVTYFGVMGVVFIPFLFFLIKPIFKGSSYFFPLIFAFFIGVAFNEYVTSPYFWIAYGCSLGNSNFR